MAEQISSLDKPITLADWHEIYQRLLPYLGGNKAVDGNPIGTVITHLGATPPAGYLVCDGSKLSATAFPLLFDVLKELPSATRATWGDADWVTEFNVPNLYGEFPRFSGTNSHANQGNGANVGVHQNATEQLNTWTYNNNGFYIGGEASKNYFVKNSDSTTTPISSVAVHDRESTYTTSHDAYYTSRPTNTSFLPCIKYTYVTQEVEYSDVEHIVGTWTENGVTKTLYERTMNTTISAIQTIASLTPASNAVIRDYSVKCFCNGEMTVPVAFSNDGYGVTVWVENNKTIGLRTSKSEYVGQKVQAVIRYTKSS